MDAGLSGDADLRQRTEKWFVRRGVPHFIDGYSASEDVFTRAWPLLTFIFLAESVSAVSGDLPRWANVLAVVVGLALVVATLALLNRVRGRPWYRRPNTIGASPPKTANRTVADEPNLARLSSDPMPDPDFYQLTVEDAAASGKPTVIVFATPGPQ